MSRRVRIRALVAVVVAFVAALPAMAPADATLVVTGKDPATLRRVYEQDGETWIGARALLEALGYQVTWNASSEKLIGHRDDRSVLITPGIEHVVAGAKTRRLAHAPRYIGGELCVPVEFVERALPQILDTQAHLESIHPTPIPAAPTFAATVSVLKKIVVDAGHGGHDAGATSPEGIKEKDINLGVALKLRELLERNTGIEVVLTRDGDYFIPLAGRTQIGNRSEADLFLSIHSNGSVNRAATGLETYFLAYEATDRQAARLAAEENRVVSLEEDSPFAAFTEGDDLAAMLRDMVNADNMRASEHLAAAVQRRIVEYMHLPNRGVKQAPFFVLVGSKNPAILVEVGFASNPVEARRLAEEQTQWVLAEALYQAIVYYDQTLADSRAGERP